MTNTLTVARTGLAEALIAEGFRVAPEVPQTFSPPLTWITARSPYRAPGQTLSRKRVLLAVICLAAQGTNAAALAAVEQLTSDVADAVEATDGFRLDAEEIGVPQLYSSAQGQEYLGASVNVIVEVNR